MTAVHELKAEQQARMFLTALVRAAGAGALVELRWRRPNAGGMGRVFVPANEARRAAALAVERGKTTDVYAGIAPRAHEAGGKDAVPAVSWLWADCDSAEACKALAAFEPAPPMLVRSSPGRGHAYWPLRQTLEGDEADRALRRLAHALGADERCAERARILRVPGTYNHKTDPPEPVRLVRFEPPAQSFLVADVVGGLPDPEPERDAPAAIRRPARLDGTVADVLRAIPADAYVPALTGRPAVRGYVQCPFHGDGRERTPSLWIGGRAGHEADWRCFGCDAGGGIFDLAARLWGMDTRRDFPALIDRLTTELLGGRAAA
jgi:hypothetical protein